MFDNGDWMTLLDKLRYLTEIEKVKWYKPAEDTLALDVGDVCYVIYPRDRDGQAPWQFSVRQGSDGEWNIVDELTSTGGPDVGTDAGTKIVPLKELAWRQANNTNNVIRGLMDELDSIDPGDPPAYSAVF
jgi:hypothetical protein